MKNIHDYSDIMDLPYNKSKRHPWMSLEERAAQFSPFAALTGHKASILETERLVDEKKELDESQKEIINRTLQDAISNHKYVYITYFVKDALKQGGAYFDIRGYIKKIDEYQKYILVNDLKIKINDLYSIEVINDE